MYMKTCSHNRQAETICLMSKAIEARINQTTGPDWWQSKMKRQNWTQSEEPKSSVWCTGTKPRQNVRHKKKTILVSTVSGNKTHQGKPI